MFALFLEEQSGHGLHRLPFHLHLGPFFFIISWFTDFSNLNLGHFQKNLKKKMFLSFFFPSNVHSCQNKKKKEWKNKNIGN